MCSRWKRRALPARHSGQRALPQWSTGRSPVLSQTRRQLPSSFLVVNPQSPSVTSVQAAESSEFVAGEPMLGWTWGTRSPILTRCLEADFPLAMENGITLLPGSKFLQTESRASETLEGRLEESSVIVNLVISLQKKISGVLLGAFLSLWS